MDIIKIKGIVLTRKGNDAVVEAWMPDGSYVEVIREPLDANFSHCVHAGGIDKAQREHLVEAFLERDGS